MEGQGSKIFRMDGRTFDLQWLGIEDGVCGVAVMVMEVQCARFVKA